MAFLINHIMILYFNTKYYIMAKRLAVVCKLTFPKIDIVNHNNIFCIAHNKSINNDRWRKHSKVTKLRKYQAIMLNTHKMHYQH